MLDGLLIALAAAGTLLAAALLLRTPAPEHPRSAGALVAALDRDGDGAISPAEYAAASDGSLPFALADADGSGALEPWEVEILLARTTPLIRLDNDLPRVR